MKMLVSGKWVDAESGEVIEKINPFNGKVVDVFPKGGREDARKAIDAAQEAKELIADMPFREREKILLKAAELVDQQKEEIAKLDTMEVGKPIKESMYDVGTWTVGALRGYAGEARRIFGEIVPLERTDKLGLVLREPWGVVGVIIAWNYPIDMAAYKMGGALAAGNAVVEKPSSKAPLCSLKLGEIFMKAGMPPGVVNVVTGPGSIVGDEIVVNRGVDAITITGETVTGKSVAEKAGKYTKKVVLELGGMDPLIVLADADLDKAVEANIVGTYSNCGQICIATKRVILMDKIYDEYIKRLVPRVKELNIGDPMDPHTDIGPLIDEEAAQKVETLVNDAIDNGAKALVGGKRFKGKSGMNNWFEPTVLVNVTPDMRIAQEEPFGPVAPIMKVSDIDEAIEVANGTKYGLQAAVFTNNLYDALYVGRKVKAGAVMVNDMTYFWEELMPFGGMKESGIGREGGKYYIQEMTDLKTIIIHGIPSKRR